MTAKIAIACLLAIAPAMALAVADGPDHFTVRIFADDESYSTPDVVVSEG